MNMKLVIPVLCLLAAGPARAETPADDIIVTGTRTPAALGRLPLAATVLNRADIERLQVQSLEALLSGVSGIDVDNSGGYGKVSGVRMRGTESDHLLLIIDGIRVGSATVGTPAFPLIPVALIERVEIVRGPRSSMWGSDAIGGVIQIFTRKGSDKRRYFASAGLGTEATYRATAGASGGHERFYYSGSVDYLDTGGIDAIPGSPDAKSADRDGYRNLSFTLRGGYQFANEAELDLSVLRAAGNTQFDPLPFGGRVFPPARDETDFRQRVISGALLLKPRDFWNLTLRLGESRDERTDLDTVPPISPSTAFNTQRLQAAMQNDFAPRPGHLVTLGLDYRDDRVSGTTSYVESSRYNYGVYTQYLAELGAHRLTASARLDKNEAFGNALTGALGWHHRFRNGMRLYASYGTAFKTPSFNELYFPGFGAPDLKPESSESFEAGTGGPLGAGDWDLRVYHTEIKDLIGTALAGGRFTAANTAAARIIGLEGRLDLKWRNWTSSLVFDLIDPEDRATGKRLARRARKNLTYDLYYNLDKWRLGGRVNARGDRFDNAANSVKLSGFVTVDMTAEYRINKHLSLRARAGNLLDKDYETISGYNALGRNVFFSVHYQNF